MSKLWLYGYQMKARNPGNRVAGTNLVFDLVMTSNYPRPPTSNRTSPPSPLKKIKISKSNYKKSVSKLFRFLWVNVIFRFVAYLLNVIC